jgi:hypothetical protein
MVRDSSEIHANAHQMLRPIPRGAAHSSSLISFHTTKKKRKWSVDLHHVSRNVITYYNVTANVKNRIGRDFEAESLHCVKNDESASCNSRVSSSEVSRKEKT